MIITISGTPGSGKSTVAKKLVEEMKFERSYAGGILRKLARDKNMTIEELMEFAKTHPEIDTEVDNMVRDEARNLNAQGKNVVVEGRVQYHFLPESLKFFIKVDPKEAAKRIFKDLQDEEIQQERNEQIVKTVEEVEEKVMKRAREDADRLVKIYNTDYLDESNYDVIIDSTHLSIEEAVNKVKESIKNLTD